MNKHILLVMKYLKDPKSVSLEELIENRKSAAYAASSDAAYAAAYAVDAAYSAAYAVADVAYAAYGAYAAYAARWVDEYFKRTGEDKQAYINELEKS